MAISRHEKHIELKTVHLPSFPRTTQQTGNAIGAGRSVLRDGIGPGVASFSKL